MPTQYETIPGRRNWLGYQTRRDPTMINERAVVKGSQNMILDAFRKWITRKGFTVLGATNSAFDAIEGAFGWKPSSGAEIMLRGYDDELEFYTTAVGAWTRLKDGWSDVDFKFAAWWSTSEGIDLLIIVVGDSNLYEWSGGIATVDSVTTSTITKTGSGTWAQARFLTAGTRKVVIGGVEYTYTGGESTTTLTGVTPDPVAGGVSNGDLAFQALRTNSDKPAAGFTNDMLEVIENQLVVASETSREIYISKSTDFLDYAFSTPRLPGEGALLTLDNASTGLIVKKSQLYMTGGLSDWYLMEYKELEIGSALAETVNVRKLETGSSQAAREHDLIAKVKGAGVVFISQENSLDILEQVEGVESDDEDEGASVSLSDPVKSDFDDENFAGGDIHYNKREIYVSSAVNGRFYRYDLERKLWYPPQLIPVGKFTDFEGDLYGHSSVHPETYKLNDGTSDNVGGNVLPVNAVLAFAYRSFGDRETLKRFDEWFTEGYISSNTTLNVKVNIELDGSVTILEDDIVGSDDTFLFEANLEGGLGDNPLGDVPLGGGGGEEGEFQISKFRKASAIAPVDFFEVQVVYSTNDEDQQWAILSQGPNVVASPNQPTHIKTKTILSS